MTLAEYLKAKKLSQNHFARDAGVPQASINAYLRGVSGISSGTALKIVEATNGEVGLADLVRRRSGATRRKRA